MPQLVEEETSYGDKERDEVERVCGRELYNNV